MSVLLGSQAKHARSCVLMVPGEKAVLMNVLKHAAEIGADVILSMAGVAVSQGTEELIASICVRLGLMG